MQNFRTGFGYDVHRLVPQSPLIIGGVTIDHHKGASGHSDADVLLHAISDALLGAAALGDIGQHFPENDQKLKGIDSSKILKEVNEMLQAMGYWVSNIDSTVVLQEPVLAGNIRKMRSIISGILGIDIDAISVKASTTEHLGYLGKGEGIAAYATVLVYRTIE